MYIPRPAKLLFTVDDGWNRYLEKHGDSVSQWTQLAVERMLACGTCAMGVRRYCCASPALHLTVPTPASSARAASQRPAA
nr:transposase zinc-binding domain-containing protein [Candidatus Erwinia dacicola]